MSETPENTGIELSLEDLNSVMEAMKSDQRQAICEDPLQGFDFKMLNWNQPSPTQMSIDFMAETVWVERGLMMSDLAFIPQGWRPIPDVIFIKVGRDEEDFARAGVFDAASEPSKTLIIHTTGRAQFVETRMCNGRSVAAVELCIDYTKLEVVDAMPTITEEVDDVR